MRIAKYLIFAVWMLLTSMVLLAPAKTVRSTGEAIKQQPVIHAHKGSAVYNSVDDGDNWHLFLFFGLAALALNMTDGSRRSLLLLLLALNGYSLATEVIQEHWIPGRAFEWKDVASNAIGIATGLLAVGVWRWAVRRWGGGRRAEGGGPVKR